MVFCNELINGATGMKQGNPIEFLGYLIAAALLIPLGIWLKNWAAPKMWSGFNRNA